MRAKFVRVLTGVVMATALLGAVGFSSVGGSQASAAQTYPKQGQTSVKVLELQQRLVKAKVLKTGYVTGYFGDRTATAVKAYQKKSSQSQTGKVGAGTWNALVKATGKVSLAEVPGIDKRCKTKGRVLCVDKTRDKLFYLKDKTVVQVMDARFGCANTKTREGQFKVFRKSRNHVSSIYHTPMPFAMFFSGGQAVHYSADFAARGYRGCSHGCANIRDKSGITWLFDQVKIGDRVVVYRS